MNRPNFLFGRLDHGADENTTDTISDHQTPDRVHVSRMRADDPVRCFEHVLHAETPRTSAKHALGPVRRTIRRTEFFHQADEFGETRGDHGGIVDGNGGFTGEAHGQERHGNSVIEMRGHHPAA